MTADGSTSYGETSDECTSDGGTSEESTSGEDTSDDSEAKTKAKTTEPASDTTAAALTEDDIRSAIESRRHSRAPGGV